MRPRPLPLLVALLLCATAAVAVPAVDARAPPTPVCGVCDLDRTTPSGERVVAGESELTVTIHANGSTTWRARADLSAGADALAANESLRDAVAAEAADDGVADPRGVTARLDGETLVVDYRDPNATDRSLGAVVFTPLTPAAPGAPFVIGGEGSRYLAADRLTVRGEPGWAVRGDAPGGSDAELVWPRETADADDAERLSLDVDRDPVAVEAGAVLPGPRAWIARLLAGDGP
ncbi:hypothetical protein EXE43_04300 [Halorubrum sp. SS5]|nr:hypothetical protein EXE43_04300 [Halorubrum sp. SS5]